MLFAGCAHDVGGLAKQRAQPPHTRNASRCDSGCKIVKIQRIPVRNCCCCYKLGGCRWSEPPCRYCHSFAVSVAAVLHAATAAACRPSAQGSLPCIHRCTPVIHIIHHWPQAQGTAVYVHVAWLVKQRALACTQASPSVPRCRVAYASLMSAVPPSASAADEPRGLGMPPASARHPATAVVSSGLEADAGAALASMTDQQVLAQHRDL